MFQIEKCVFVNQGADVYTFEVLFMKGVAHIGSKKKPSERFTRVYLDLEKSRGVVGLTWRALLADFQNPLCAQSATRILIFPKSKLQSD